MTKLFTESVFDVDGRDYDAPKRRSWWGVVVAVAAALTVGYVALHILAFLVYAL